MTKDEMMTEVIRANGFENKWTIWFFELCDTNLSNDALMSAMVCATTMPKMEAEAEEDE